MPNVTFSVPPDLHREMKAHPEIKWSEVARRAFRHEIERLHVWDKVFAKSKLTENDAAELGRDIRRRAAGRRK